ncbi:uncharacterized protein LOC129217242 [Uloborus diversus]|uniref:uncharacterized protein LOC129217242 n=1 Tax=Uloborus diversus TaxID=327109 RepID=UPI00240A0438|nr:uncharacterized protein LOC129217242 [Uloborus diversus]
MYLHVSAFLAVVFHYVLCLPNQGGSRLLRLARGSTDEISLPLHHSEPSGGDVLRGLLSAHALDRLGGGELLRALAPLSGGAAARALERIGGGGERAVDSLDGFRGGEVLIALDRLTGGELLASFDDKESTAVLEALEMARQRSRHRPAPKRTLDTLSGMAFGNSKKRFDSLSGSTFGLSKRDFDEIDNVGFTGFAKRGRGGLSLALAKKNFDEIDRAGFETYNKRNFDEIDRTGFETFEKRDRKE